MQSDVTNMAGGQDRKAALQTFTMSYTFKDSVRRVHGSAKVR